MSVTVEINELSNNSSKLGIYINDRPIYWTGRAIEKPAIDKNPHHFMRYITGLALLPNLINKFTAVTVPKDDSNGYKYKQAIAEGEKALFKRFGAGDDFDKLMQLCTFTDEISNNMLNKQYCNDGPKPLIG
ncbi:hypothetical protein ABVC46_02145 [Lactobacillus crispatus]|jgi:hypothetical protein|uniref:Uncharacterized protein n=1 Tax=Lactobacillus crispatus TaxID=47770 RepID=A0AAW8WUR3_9LACO|nr:hypothetical protein [Lactobacillus crispatus]MCZ3493496.1 hypothetical protein [Lactobacillus gasseri]MCT7696890.1 hypothetical protein [Lactobacillus crispatus]MCT7708355.1 hypothetical protein [Lactobacillus crispatus]MCT7730821.1 hypothetical protein [Lactobacillus crispatus]MCT7807609.1 hypothetical protein [Lactobacillus crispatus]